MQKISNAKVAELLSDAAAILRQVTMERDDAQTKLAAMAQRREVEKVAAAMKDKGITGEPTEHLIESLEKAAEEGRLDRIRDAVDLVGPDMWSKFATPTDDRPQAGGMSDFEQYLLNA